MSAIRFALQRALLVASYQFFRLGGRKKTISWVVGVQEIASMAHHIAQLIPRSHSAVLWHDAYFDFKYDTSFSRSLNPVVAEFLHSVLGPIHLGRLINRAEGFLYLGELGFLPLSETNYREFEFRFIKSKGCAVACYFVGSDIRSPQLMRELGEQIGAITLGTQLPLVNPVFGTIEYETRKKRIADVADEYADVVFSASVDQRSYLVTPTHPITYFYPDEKFSVGNEKFENPGRIVVVHAPSSPIIKGTPLVRDAVERLQALGYEFEYVELSGVSNDEVGAELRRAHIALNQFYAFIPGVFGIEALAANCAVLMSADERIEPDLPVGSNRAWVVTRHDEIFEKLKGLLDSPDEIREQANRGRDWAREHVSISHAGPILNAVLEQTLSRVRSQRNVGSNDRG